MMLINPCAAFIIGNPCPVRAFDQEAVDHLLVVADDAGLIIIKKVVTVRPGHQRAGGQRFKHQNNPAGAVLRHPETDRHGIVRIGLGGKTVGGSFITENGRKDRMTEGHGQTSCEWSRAIKTEESRPKQEKRQKRKKNMDERAKA